MLTNDPSGCRCPGGDEVLSDLSEQDLLALQQGERLWKLYCFHTKGNATGLRHRIYTKVKANGRLALITYAAHNPPRNGSGHAGGHGAPERVRSALARVPDLSAADLDRLIGAMRSQAGSDACEEIDLSHLKDLEEQLASLRSQILE